MIIRSCIVMGLLLAPSFLSAETIEMKDGRVFEGELVTETEESLRIREFVGDGSIESDVEKSQVLKVGDRVITEEETPREEEAGEKKAGRGKAKPAIDWESKERIEYENNVKDICDEIRRVKNIWDMTHENYDAFREWHVRFEGIEKRFRERYSKTFVSYEFVNMVFLELNHFIEAVDAMRKLEESARKNASESWRQRFRQCQVDNERIAGESLKKTIHYADMARTKILKR